MDSDDDEYESDESVLDADIADQLEVSIPKSLHRNPIVCVVCRVGNNKTARFPDHKALLQHATSRAQRLDRENRKMRRFHLRIAELLKTQLEDSLPCVQIQRNIENPDFKNAVKMEHIQETEVGQAYVKQCEDDSTIDKRKRRAVSIKKAELEARGKLQRGQHRVHALIESQEEHKAKLTELQNKYKEEFERFEKQMEEITDRQTKQMQEHQLRINRYAKLLNSKHSALSFKERVDAETETIRLAIEYLSLRDQNNDRELALTELQEKKKEMSEQHRAISEASKEQKERLTMLAEEQKKLEDCMTDDAVIDEGLNMTIEELKKLGISCPPSDVCVKCNRRFTKKKRQTEEKANKLQNDIQRVLLSPCGCHSFCQNCVKANRGFCPKHKEPAQALPLERIFL